MKKCTSLFSGISLVNTLKKYRWIIALTIFFNPVSLLAQFAGGNGTEENPYQVSTAAELDSVRDHTGQYFELMNDIDLDVAPYNTGLGWTPIGELNKDFEIHFDGKGYTIRNLFIDNSNLDLAGLFGVIEGENSSIRNLTLSDVNIKTVGMTQGGLIGLVNGGELVIENCAVEINAEFQSENFQIGAGGLIGYIYNGNVSISNSYAQGALLSDKGSSSSNTSGIMGGLIGTSDISGGVKETIITNSYSNVSIRSINDDYSMIGGLIGFNQQGNLKISNSYVHTDSLVNNTGTTAYVGGIIGYYYGDDTLSITNSYSVAGLQSKIETGGTIGFIQSGVAVIDTTSMFYNKEIAGITTNSYGVGKTTLEMKTESTYTNEGWDFENVWGMYDNDSYPSLYVMYGFNGGGFGTKTTPFRVHTASELDSMRYFEGKYFALQNDIDLDVAPFNSGQGWSPIGDIVNPFSNYFNGAGYSISNLYINRPDSSNVGLFGVITKGSVNSVDLIDADVTGGTSTGALIGSVTTSDSVLVNTTSGSGQVTGTNDTGGLIGIVTTQSGGRASVQNSYSSVSVNGTDRVGGLLGKQVSEGSGSENLVFKSNSYGSVHGTTNVGGLIGYQSSSTEGQVNVENSFSMSDVDGSMSVGGLIGAQLLLTGCDSNCIITSNNFVSGNVQGTLDTGGIIGNYNNGSGTGGMVANTYWSPTITGLNAGGSWRSINLCRNGRLIKF